MRILLTEDDNMIREIISNFLVEELDHQVTQCNNGRIALELYTDNPFDLVLTDLRMPETNGMELLKSIKASPNGEKTDVVMMTGHGDMKTAITAFREGAYDYLLKPIEIEELINVVNRIAERQALLNKNQELTQRVQTLTDVNSKTESKLKNFQNIYAEVMGIGKIGVFSTAMREVVAIAERYHQDRTVPILIEGETGTGKEIIARLIHFGDSDTSAPFISINCSAITPSLFESELFGYEEGSFTGAKKEGAVGKFELANNGTLFLDEIGDMPLDLQPKILRVIQEMETYRVGGQKKIYLDVRIICATNQNLSAMAKNGEFRQDLYYRLSVGEINIPPLNKRREAIGPLAQMFLEHFAEFKKRRFRYLNKDTVNILENYPWPGNVRELQNTIERVVLLYDDIEVRPEHISFLSSGPNDLYDTEGSPLLPGSIVLPPEKLDFAALEAEIVKKALTKFNGNKTKTADYLGISQTALRTKLKRV